MLAQPRDLAVDAAGRDDAVVDLQIIEELLHLLLLALHRQKEHEIEDRHDEGVRNELQPQAAAFERGTHGVDRTESESCHESDTWRGRLMRSASLKLSNRPNAIASLIRRIVSR